jgi:hypothetical protein
VVGAGVNAGDTVLSPTGFPPDNPPDGAGVGVGFNAFCSGETANGTVIGDIGEDDGSDAKEPSNLYPTPLTYTVDPASYVIPDPAICASTILRF